MSPTARSTDPIPEPAQPDDLFVAFANTLAYQRGVPVDAVPDPSTLLDWLAANGLLTAKGRGAEAQRFDRDPAEADRRMERFRFLRDLVVGIAERTSAGTRPTRTQIRDLNHVLRHGLHYHQLLPGSDAARYSVAQVGDRLDQARATIASSLAYFLAEDEATRLRVCNNASCREVFIDRSPTGRRRWCDMRICGNQAKVARHRARARQTAEIGRA